jgi:transglutaminase-like putative cysteine protease
MIEDVDIFRRPTWYVNSDAPEIGTLAREIAGAKQDEVERACRLFYAVRDGIRYSAYDIDLDREALRATHVLAAGAGWCVSKSVLLAALCRSVGIACRLGYADVCNHMATKKLLDFLGTNVFYYHGFNELYLGGKWVKATVAFNRTLCQKARLAPLDFDGVHDSIYHPFDLAGHRYMEYLRLYVPTADVPYDDLIATFARVYPKLGSSRGRGNRLEGDFESEIESEAAN